VFGKLSLTWYPEAFTKQVASTDMGMRPNKKTGNPGRTYRFYTGTPVFKFGEGLRYSTFNSKISKISKMVGTTTEEDLDLDLDLDLHALVDSESRMGKTHYTSTQVGAATVSVSNTGDMDGDEIVMLFGAPPKGIAGRDGNPIQSLIAYERVNLRVGETKQVTMPVTTHAFKLVDGMGVGFTAKGDWEFWLGVRSELASDADITTFAL